MLALSRRIKKLILIRLLFAVILLYAPQVVQDLNAPIIYLSCLSVAILSLAYAFWLSIQRRIRQLVVVQIFLDLLLETFLLIHTGGAESLIAALYVLSIMSAGLVLGEKRYILGATIISCVGYVFGSLVALRSGGHSLIINDIIYFLYVVLVRIIIFFCVGQLSLYWGQTVRELQTRIKFMEQLSLLGEVVSKVAHEIRNPLSAIRTAAGVLKDSLKEKLGSQDEKMFNVIEGESQRLMQTVERILGYVRDIRPNPKNLLLDPLIERVLSIVRLKLKESPDGVVVQKKYDPNVHVRADEEQILSVLLNLIVNAYQAMNRGGLLQIRASEVREGTTIDIEDSGPGIPSDQLKDLFQPFKSSKRGGTGLGLAEVHKIVMLHGGKIEVDSWPGKGTIFRLHFPKM